MPALRRRAPLPSSALERLMENIDDEDLDDDDDVDQEIRSLRESEFAVWARTNNELARWLTTISRSDWMDVIGNQSSWRTIETYVHRIVSGETLTRRQTAWAQRKMRFYENELDYLSDEDEDEEDDDADDLWRFWSRENQDVVRFLDGWRPDLWLQVGGHRAHMRRLVRLAEQVDDHMVLSATDITYVHRRIRQFRDLSGLDNIEQAAVDAAANAISETLSPREPRMSEVTGRFPR